MKIVKGFVLRNVSGDNVVMPQGSALMKLNGLLLLNETATFIWNSIVRGGTDYKIDQLVNELCEQYAVDVNVAKKDVEAFIERLKTIGCME